MYGIEILMFYLILNEMNINNRANDIQYCAGTFGAHYVLSTTFKSQVSEHTCIRTHAQKIMKASSHME